MEKEEQSLFGNFSLMDNGLIEVNPVQETNQQSGSEETPANEQKEQKQKEQEVNDNTFEIEDIVKTIETASTQEVETTEDKDKNPPQTNSGNSSSSHSNYVPFAKALFEEGVLNDFDETEFTKLVEESGPAEALIELNRRTIESEIENYKKEADEDYKAFLQARDSGVDMNEWGKIYSSKKQYNNITDDALEADEEMQKTLIKADLKRRNFEDDEIDTTLESYEDTGKLSKMAKQSLKNLKKFEDDREQDLIKETQRRQEEFIVKQKQQLETLKKTINDSNEIVPGMKINKQTKDKIYNMITTEVKKGPNGEPLNAVMAKRMEDPIKYSILEAYLVDIGVFDGKLDTIVKKSKSEAIKTLESTLSSLNNTDFKTGKSPVEALGDNDDVDPIYDAAWKRV